MKLFVGVLGLALVLLFGLHGAAPLFGLDDGLIGDWAVVVLVLVSLPLGARMAILRHRAKRKTREEASVANTK